MDEEGGEEGIMWFQFAVSFPFFLVLFVVLS